MSLEIINEGPYCCPKIVCDHCAEVIETGSEGNYQWQINDTTVYFTHKRCCRAFEQARPGPWMAVDLSLLPLYLGNNLNLDTKKVRKLAQMAERIG